LFKLNKINARIFKCRCRVKYILSYFKSEWDLDDYPIRIKYQKDHATNLAGRLIPIPCIAQITNWWGMAGHGNTKEQALSDLRNKFNNYKVRNRLPRPGTKVPIKFEFASTNEIDQYEFIAADFFKKVLNMNYYDCFISDESSLWDFHNEETNEHLYEKILENYEVDVSDIESGNLVEIFKRIELLSNKY